MKKLAEFKKEDWNLDKIKKMSYTKFRDMVIGWAEGLKGPNGKPKEREIEVVDGQTGEKKMVKQLVGVSIQKPTEAEIKAAYEKWNGGKVEPIKS
jgi:hypothetical protein